MLARYRMYRGKRPPWDPLPNGIRQDTRYRTKHPLRPAPEMVEQYLASPNENAWRKFRKAYLALLEERFRRDRTPFERLAGLATENDVFLGRFGLDAFLSVVRRPQVLLIAAAAHTTGGFLRAFPVSWRPGTGDYAHVDVGPGTPVYGVQRFVSDKDVFLIATGVSENVALKGVRFQPRHLATTHTLVLRSKTKTMRFITNQHDLKVKQFRIYGECDDCEEIIAELKGRKERAHDG